MKKSIIFFNYVLKNIVMVQKIFLFSIVLASCLDVHSMDKKTVHTLLYESLYNKSIELSKKITDRADAIKKILSDYQTYHVTDYEIERSVKTLRGLDHNSMYLKTPSKIDSIAVMLPSNLPLYSLVIFGLIPSFLAKSVFVRPNMLLQDRDIISRIYDVLDLKSLFPNLAIITTDYLGFKEYIARSSLVVFTGRPAHAENIIKMMKNNSILVVNGSGHNPVVVTESADIDQAVDGALLLKSFNSGQDCAGPDAILVHHDKAQEFVKKFYQKFSLLKKGTYKDFETIIGPINRLTELQKFVNILYDNRKDIISGGEIDFKKNIVSPTTIVRGIERYPNYQEMFGPITFIHPYKKDQDLSYYFQDPDGRYQSNRMYVTLYGKSDYVASRDDSKQRKSGNVGIVLNNKTIHDTEIGYKPYGGYSFGASCIIKKTAKGKLEKAAMPILLPQVIFDYLINKKKIPCLANESDVKNNVLSVSCLKKDSQIDPIIVQFQTLIKKIFGANLVFGFIFGSAAQGKLKVKGPDRDDLDTFVCIKNDDTCARKLYIEKIAELQKNYNLKIDTIFPAEIMTLAVLQKSIQSLDNFVISVDKVVTGDEFDRMFWIHALTSKKTGFVGDGKVMSNFIKKGMPFIYKWSNQIITQLKNREALPDYLHKTFSGLDKNKVIEKLSHYSPHLVVHLGLSYDDNALSD